MACSFDLDRRGRISISLQRRERNREDDAAGRDALDTLVRPILDAETGRGLASHPDDGRIVANDVSERRRHGPRQQVHPAGDLVTLRGTAQHRKLPEHVQRRQIGGVAADRHPRDRLGRGAARSKIFRPADPVVRSPSRVRVGRRRRLRQIVRQDTDVAIEQRRLVRTVALRGCRGLALDGHDRRSLRRCERRQREAERSDGSQHRLMHAGDADRPGLGVQAVVERRADRQHPAAGTFARFEDDDLASCPPQEVGRAHAGEARADDNGAFQGFQGSRRPAGRSLQQRRRGGSRQGGDLEKPSTSNVSPHCEPAAEPPF